MLRNKALRYGIATFILIVVGWIAVTFYVEKTGPAKQWSFGTGYERTALVVFDSDPFYNLDEQVCLAFGEALAKDSIDVTIATVAAAKELPSEMYGLVVYCANTYNWKPDWSITNYIREHPPTGRNIPVIAITLGAGSTESSQRSFEMTIINAGGKLLESYSLWLWRPNDEAKLEQPNVDVAVDMAREWAEEISNRIN